MAGEIAEAVDSPGVESEKILLNYFRYRERYKVVGMDEAEPEVELEKRPRKCFQAVVGIGETHYCLIDCGQVLRR